MISRNKYAVFRPLNSPFNQLVIQECRNGFPNTYLDMGMSTHLGWLGNYQRNYNLWLAGVAGNQITYTRDFGAPGTINFPNISNAAPCWVLIGRFDMVAVQEQALQLDFDVYPNPVQNQKFTLRLNQSSSSSAAWEIYDIQGRRLLFGKTDQNEQEMDLSGLSSGIYSLKVTIEHKTGIQRIIVP